MPRKKAQAKPAATASAPSSAFAPVGRGRRTAQTPAPPPTVSARWLAGAVGVALIAATVCAWCALCLLFWQGSWQLLYHPTAAVTRTPTSAGLAFDPVGFATTETGAAQLKGWWIPAGPSGHYSRYTVLYLHGQNGNLGNAMDSLAQLHAVGVNVLAFDYRGYGQSQFERPSEARWRQDAEWALQHLTGTRHIAASTILLEGKDLGANLALEVAAAHPELAGVVLESPLEAPVEAIFRDARARLVPAHLLNSDRFNADEAANALLVPSLWLISPPVSNKPADQTWHRAGYDRITTRKTLVWLMPSHLPDQHFADAYNRWLDDLPKKASNP